MLRDWTVVAYGGMWHRLVKLLAVLPGAVLFFSAGAACGATERFVDVNSTNAVPPFTNWAQAAVEIQAAVDAAEAGDVIWVTNGVYESGGIVVFGLTSNRVAVTKPLTLQSVNGPLATIIRGQQLPWGEEVRCAYLTNGVVLAGFTLTNGSASAWGLGDADESGGGVWCEAGGVVLSNCIVAGNQAYARGGGVYRGILYGCSISNNTARNGGGVYGATNYNTRIHGNHASDFGGGAEDSELHGCVIADNSAVGIAGGISRSAATNCVITGNHDGAGWLSTVVGCTITNNYANGGTGGIDGSTAVGCLIANNDGGFAGGAAISSLTRCVLTGNIARGGPGGAGYCRVTNCLVNLNTGSGGGGTANSIVVNSALFLNSADYGGGSLGDTLFNCTVTGNVAREQGGGGYVSTFYNCIVYYNESPNGPNYAFDDYFGGSLNHSCTTPLPGSGTNNFTADPQLASPTHLSPTSPCRGAGSAALTTGFDLDGDVWLNPPSVGCDEVRTGTAIGPLSATILAPFTTVAKEFPLRLDAVVEGRATHSWWDFGDGQSVSNRPYVAHQWTAPGDYPVVFWLHNETHPGGLSFTQMVHVTEGEHFVTLANTNAASPFTNWATAAANIQDAVDAAPAGATVTVSDGVYRSGARVVSGTLSNRVVVLRPVTLRSQNGPAATVIEGYPVIGDSAVRCIYLATGATLEGFTLTNGGTAASGDPDSQQSGGGVWCPQTTNAFITNCIFAGNFAFNEGGGAMHGTLAGCSFSNNTANVGGAVCLAGLRDCRLIRNRAKQDAGAAHLSVLDRCYLLGNSAGNHGGAASSCTLNACALVDNTCAENGGAVAACTLTNCTLTGNSGHSGGGANSSTLYNCIVHFNTDGAAGNFSNCTLYHCNTWPLPESGTNNFTDDPQLASATHLGLDSPCRGRGQPRAPGERDIDSQSWSPLPALGCDEPSAGGALGDLSVSIRAVFTNVVPGTTVPFTADIEGQVTASRWDFSDGTVLSNRPYASHAWTALGNYAVELRAFNDSFPDGIAVTTVVHVVAMPTYYVSLTNSDPVPPHDSWATAATNLQEAVDAASVAGARILVADGVYQTGGRAGYGGLTNRVLVDKPLHLESLNGPLATTIRGVSGIGSNAVRCLQLTNQCSLTGFTVAEGGTRSVGDDEWLRSGGGVWSSDTNNSFVNCVFLSNNAAWRGGGVYRGTLSNCILSFNLAVRGGGGYAVTMTACSVTSNSVSGDGAGFYEGSLLNGVLAGNRSSGGSGGGAAYARLENCLVISNWVPWVGGGLLRGSATNCQFIGNQANYAGGGTDQVSAHGCTFTSNLSPNGGGAASSTLYLCDVAGNRPATFSMYDGGAVVNSHLERCRIAANWGGGVDAGSVAKNCVIAGNSGLRGGVNSSTVENCTVIFNARYDAPGGIVGGSARNCIIYYNFKAPDQFGYEFGASDLRYCCSSVLAPGPGNFTNAPLFLNWDASDYRLQSNSPCINAGFNADASTAADKDGNPRITGGTVDVGAYEYLSPASALSYHWLQTYGLPWDGTADFQDTDGDGMNNWQEWRAATIPTNAASVLRLLTPSNSPVGLALRWSSAPGVAYVLERASDAAASAYGAVASNLAGQAGATVFLDTNTAAGSHYFYRVRVQ